MRSNRLQLYINAIKTEVLWCASARRQDQLTDLPFSSGLTQWSLYAASELWASTSTQMCPGGPTSRRQSPAALRHYIKSAASDVQSASQSCCRSCRRSLVLLRLDYGCATLAGIPTYMLDRLHAPCRSKVDIRKTEVRPCYSRTCVTKSQICLYH